MNFEIFKKRQRNLEEEANLEKDIAELIAAGYPITAKVIQTGTPVPYNDEETLKEHWLKSLDIVPVTRKYRGTYGL